MKLYMGFDWSSKRRKLNTYPYCFLSAAVCWSYTMRKSLPAWKINGAKEIMLDSGGFSLMNKHGDYPFTTEEYVDWIIRMNEINDNKVKYVAIRDYPCEPEISRKLGLMSNIDRIKKTVENTKECMTHDIPGEWMPVLQGYTKQEYLTCYQLLYDMRLLTDYIAVGSMCRRTNVKEIENIIETIKRGYSGNLHLFGLTFRALKNKTLYPMIESCDTIGYTYGCKKLKDTFIRFDDMVDKFNKIKLEMN